MPRMKNSIEDFQNAIESLVTNMYPNIWKLIYLLRKEEILAKKEKKCDAK